MASDAVLNIRVPVRVKSALAKAAEENMRSLSGMSVWILAGWLQANGYTDAPQSGARAKQQRKRGA